MIKQDYVTRFDYVNNEQMQIVQLSYIHSNEHASRLHRLLCNHPKCIYKSRSLLIVLKGLNKMQIFKFSYDD